jgi:hypothetical protein
MAKDQFWKGSFSPENDLQIGAKSVVLTLATNVGSVPIPDTARLVGVKPTSSTGCRVGLEAPEAAGTSSGTAVAGDLKKGIPVDAAVWSWFWIGDGTSRILYLRSSDATAEINVAVV